MRYNSSSANGLAQSDGLQLMATGWTTRVRYPNETYIFYFAIDFRLALELIQNLIQRVESSVVWDIKPSSTLKVSRRFRETCRLHFQDRRINQARNQNTYFVSASCCFLARLILRSPWRWMREVPPKRRIPFNGLHGVISRKIKFFITTAVITSNPALSNEYEGSFPGVNRPGHEAASLGMRGNMPPVPIRLHGVIHN
jgi:hypothetical protein